MAHCRQWSHRWVHHPRRKAVVRLALRTCLLAPFAATATTLLDGVHRRPANIAGLSGTGRSIAQGRGALRRQAVRSGIRRRHRSLSRPVTASSRRRSRLAVSVSSRRAGGIRRTQTSRGVISAGIRTTSGWIAHTDHVSSAIRGSTQGGDAPRIATMRLGPRVAARGMMGTRAGGTSVHQEEAPARRDPAEAQPWQHQR